MARSRKGIGSVREFIAAIESDYADWNTKQFPWFRGEPAHKEALPLTPKVYRPKKDGSEHDENALLQFFRMKAPILALPMVPDVDRTDQWLFLARHMGLPTRILDWTEGALIALYFALLQKEPVVWMLHPQVLNQKSVPGTAGPVPNEPTLTWHPSSGTNNIYNLNIRGAWELDTVGTEFPVAVHPTAIHPRVAGQHSCFTIHGKRKEGLDQLVGPECLRKYKIKIGADEVPAALLELRRLGISESTLFPDPEGLARELEGLF